MVGLQNGDEKLGFYVNGRTFKIVRLPKIMVVVFLFLFLFFIFFKLKCRCVEGDGLSWTYGVDLVIQNHWRLTILKSC